MRTLVEDASRRSAMGQAAVIKAHREFDERDVVARVMDTYRQVAARRGLVLTTDTISR